MVIDRQPRETNSVQQSAQRVRLITQHDELLYLAGLMEIAPRQSEISLEQKFFQHSFPCFGIFSEPREDGLGRHQYLERQGFGTVKDLKISFYPHLKMVRVETPEGIIERQNVVNIHSDWRYMVFDMESQEEQTEQPKRRLFSRPRPQNVKQSSLAVVFTGDIIDSPNEIMDIKSLLYWRISRCIAETFTRSKKSEIENPNNTLILSFSGLPRAGKSSTAKLFRKYAQQMNQNIKIKVLPEFSQKIPSFFIRKFPGASLEDQYKTVDWILNQRKKMMKVSENF